MLRYIQQDNHMQMLELRYDSKRLYMSRHVHTVVFAGYDMGSGTDSTPQHSLMDNCNKKKEEFDQKKIFSCKVKRGNEKARV